MVAKTAYKLSDSTGAVVLFVDDVELAMKGLDRQALAKGVERICSLLTTFVEAMEAHLEKKKTDSNQAALVQALAGRGSTRSYEGPGPRAAHQEQRRPPRPPGSRQESRAFGQGCREWDGVSCTREREGKPCSFSSSHVQGMCTEAYAMKFPHTPAARQFFDSQRR